MAIEVHTSFEPLSREWDELATRTGASPFTRPGWLKAWWKAFGRGGLEISVARRGNLVAVVPLCAVGGVLRSLTNPHTPLFEPLAETAHALDEIQASILVRRRPLVLSYLDAEHGSTADVVAASRRARYYTHQRTILRSPFVETAGDWATYELLLTSKRRSNLRRLRGKLDSIGHVSVEVHAGPERLGELLNDFISIEGSGWKSAQGTAIRSRPDTLCFYREVARWAAERGTLRLCFLRLDAKPLACDLSLEEGGRHYLLKTGFDPAFRSFAPGVLLRRYMLERAFSRGLTSYELLGSDNAWKSEWAHGHRERLRVEAFPLSRRGAAAWAETNIRAAARRAVRAIRR